MTGRELQYFVDALRQCIGLDPLYRLPVPLRGAFSEFDPRLFFGSFAPDGRRRNGINDMGER